MDGMIRNGWTEWIGIRNLRNINSLGYQIALGGLIIGSLVFLFEARRIPMETLNYFARPITRFNTDIKKVKKYLVISTLVILFLSSDFETFRGHWIMWGETVIAFLIYVVLLFKFGQILFIPSMPRTERPRKIYLPSMKSKRYSIILSTFLGLYLIILFIAL